MSDPLTIGQVAERSGVATSALRFYEERGLIESERNVSGHRRYPRAVVRRVAFIVFAQRVGLSLDEIRDELDKLPSGRVPARSDWQSCRPPGPSGSISASRSCSGSSRV